MTQFHGSASRLIHADVQGVWDVAVTLGWLGAAWDDVRMTTAPTKGGTFTLIGDAHEIAARWTAVRPPHELSWQGQDASNGRLVLRPTGSGQTTADYTSVNVPHAFVDKFFAGLYAMLFAGKAQAEADKHAGQELQVLAYKVENAS